MTSPQGKSEIAILREIVRIYELEAASNEMLSEQFRVLAHSRFYPLAVLLLKMDNVAERLLRRILGRPLAPRLAPPPAIPESPPADAESSSAVVPLTTSGVRKIGALTGKGIRLLGHALAVVVKGNRVRTLSPQREANFYGAWSEAFMTPNEGHRKSLVARVGLLRQRPLLSVVMATYNTDHRFLREAIDSVLAQIYPNFELIICDDCSPDSEVRAIVQSYVERDARVRLVLREQNGGISAATNAAIDAANGEWIVFMDHDDTIVEHALLHVAIAIEQQPDAMLLYSDEDKINERNQPFTPYFKSDFDPLLLLGQNYVCHLTTIRRDLMTKIGLLRSEFDGAQDWDLVLRASEEVRRNQIVHIPHILYHWRSHAGSTSRASSAKPWAIDAGRKAVAAALERRGVRGSVAAVEGTGFAQVHFSLPDVAPLVSVMIPTRDGKYLEQCVRSLLERTSYPNFEVLIIDNGSVRETTHSFFATLGERVRVIRDDRPFNYSALHNRNAQHCRGEVFVLLNDDTEVFDGDWLSAMVAQLLQPGYGAVGAKLLYPDGRIQHAGVVLGPEGLAAHVGRFRSKDDKGYFGRTALASEFQACTAACLAVRRSTWELVGGLDETLQVAWNDIDFCLRIRAQGEFVAYTPLAELLHYESVSRGTDRSGPSFARMIQEVVTMRDRWTREIVRDPYYNPNLSFSHGLFELAYPPRVSPWYTGIE